jgi:hypothetical protein
VYRLNQHTQIVTEHLAQHLVQLPDIALAPYRIPELCLDHTEGSLHVRPLMIMRQEFLPIVHEIVVHLRLHVVFLGDSRVDLEWDKRKRIGFGSRFKV